MGAAWEFAPDAAAGAGVGLWLGTAGACAAATGFETSGSPRTPLLVAGPGASATWAVVSPQATPRAVRAAWADATRLALGHDVDRLGVVVDDLSDAERAAALAGVRDAAYAFRLPGEDARPGPVLVVRAGRAQRASVTRHMALADARDAVRDWVNLPPNLKPPEALAAMFRHEAPPDIAWDLLDASRLDSMGMHGILAVGRGSGTDRPPALLVGRYAGTDNAPWLALVGKGITFDSGGISLKARDGMGRLKSDMAGAAVVMSVLRLVARLGLPVNLLALAPLAENLPDGAAYRPGDVIVQLDGTSVEIASTDAEGRLVLADAITYARRLGAVAVVDIATLTGANRVVLGGLRASLLSNDGALAAIVREAGEAAAEPVWELPHDEEYLEFIRSDVADLKNSGGAAAGTITAGMFLAHFAGTTPWAHVDIAGMALREEPGKPRKGRGGATGFGTALLVAVVEAWAGHRPL